MSKPVDPVEPQPKDAVTTLPYGATRDLVQVPNRGRIVTIAGLGINLALGVLYSWSVLSKEIPSAWGWTETGKSWPYACACLVFCLVMVPGGRMQDRIGPRIVATLGGVLVGIGMILASFTTTLTGYLIGFGLLAGAGIGCGYASATPPAVKWFPAKKTGLIAGLVVAGFGLASVYIAPLATHLAQKFGLQTTMLLFGLGFLVVVVGLAQLLVAPPKGYIPPGTPPAKPGAAAVRKEDFTPGEMLATWQFYVLWFMYACGAGAGLMIISKLAKIAQDQAGLKLGFVLVAVLAVGNGGGRIGAGLLSDRIGRKATMFICFVAQAVAIMALSRARADSFLAQPVVLALLSAVIGANYGANLALFPSVTKDYYGLKDFGVNYGLVFTAWGLGGFMLSLLAGKVYDQTHAFTFAYYCSAGLLLAAALVTFLVQPPQAKSQAPPA
ncbi:MAG TPA: OFA family MFS transporter [Phycisphaerae bacterium]|nr:OFA family MFS transporter [Phycisphaerae bacterium]HRY67518.1 OFA family MFS transporter [Phycisphaerae bacterium]HSA24905.1 OFA family MFS transporter [Phycisphaerae bacterium]